MSGDFGLSISLPSGTLSQLQRNRNSASTPTHRGTQLFDLRNDHDNHVVEDDHGIGACDDRSGELYENETSTAQSKVHFLNEKDMEIMPFVPSDSGEDDDSDDIENKKQTNNDGNHNDHSDERSYSNSDENYSEGSNEDEIDELDNLSLSPPETMPLLVVDLDKLCGYTPTEAEEAKQLENELCRALLGVKVDNAKNEYSSETPISSGRKPQSPPEQQQNDETTSTSNYSMTGGNYYGDGFSLDFTTRAIELFQDGVARHCDTEQRQNVCADDERNKTFKHAFVPYPEYIKLPQHDNNMESTIMATSKIWKRIKHPHNIPVVNKLLHLLSICSRDIMWKHDMAMEIRRIAKEESKWQDEKIRQKEVKIWKTKTRPNELEKLYDVREAFILKLEIVRQKYDGYVKEREERVQRELLRRKENGIGTGGIAGLDWDGKVTFAFDDDVEEIVQKMLLEKREKDMGYYSSEYYNNRSQSDDSDQNYDD